MAPPKIIITQSLAQSPGQDKTQLLSNLFAGIWAENCVSLDLSLGFHEGMQVTQDLKYES